MSPKEKLFLPRPVLCRFDSGKVHRIKTGILFRRVDTYAQKVPRSCCSLSWRLFPSAPWATKSQNRIKFVRMSTRSFLPFASTTSNAADVIARALPFSVSCVHTGCTFPESGRVLSVLLSIIQQHRMRLLPRRPMKVRLFQHQAIP